jgi:hypothetical protein
MPLEPLTLTPGQRVRFVRWDRRLGVWSERFVGMTGQVIHLLPEKKQACVAFGESCADHCWLPVARLEIVEESDAR